jgi:hypothetical protein
MNDSPPFFCRQPDCPGHDNNRLICLDPAVYGSPYELERKAATRRHAAELSALKIRQAEQLLALARRFGVGEDFRYWHARLKELRTRKEHFDVAH